MNIALCDDHAAELSNIVSLIEKYSSENSEPIKISAFSSGMELLETMRTEVFDAVFLDILMPGITGMDAAKEIRSSDEQIKIIFLTASAEFAVESYEVNAYYYLVKPASEEKVFSLLDRLAEGCRKTAECLKIKTRSNIFLLPYSHIEYVEVNAKRLYFFLTDGSVREVVGKLSDYESILLAMPEFIKTHRSFIVNMNRISELKRGEATTELGKNIPVSRALYQTVRSAYTRFLFQEAKISKG